MQFTISRYRRPVALFALATSAILVMGATGGFTGLARFGNAALESYDRVITDWGQHALERFDPVYPIVFEKCSINQLEVL